MQGRKCRPPRLHHANEPACATYPVRLARRAVGRSVGAKWSSCASEAQGFKLEPFTSTHPIAWQSMLI